MCDLIIAVGEVYRSIVRSCRTKIPRNGKNSNHVVFPFETNDFLVTEMKLMSVFEMWGYWDEIN